MLDLDSHAADLLVAAIIEPPFWDVRAILT